MDDYINKQEKFYEVLVSAPNKYGDPFAKVVERTTSKEEARKIAVRVRKETGKATYIILSEKFAGVLYGNDYLIYENGKWFSKEEANKRLQFVD